MQMDQFQFAQTRAGWLLCLSIGAICTFLSFMRAPNVWVPVLIISVAHVIFYYRYVSSPSERLRQTTRDFLLMVLNRGMSVVFIFLTFAVTISGVAATQLHVRLVHVGALVALCLICAFLGSRHGASQWKVRSDLEQTARDSTKMGMEFRNRYSISVFAGIGTAIVAAVRSFGDDIGVVLLATVASAMGAFVLGHVVTKQIILVRLLPKGGDSTSTGTDAAEVLDRNDLDRELEKQGWAYDNGWEHDSQRWDCYVNDKYRYGSAPQSFLLILARNGKGRLLYFRDQARKKREVWEGPLVTEADVGRLLEAVRDFDRNGRK
jgi:hypothetical protein